MVYQSCLCLLSALVHGVSKTGDVVYVLTFAYAMGRPLGDAFTRVVLNRHTLANAVASHLLDGIFEAGSA